MKITCRLICSIILIASPLSYAATVTYNFSGYVDTASHRLSPSIDPGNSFSGSLSVNGSNLSSPWQRNIINGSINVGGLAYEFTDFDLFLQDTSSTDRYLVSNGAGGISGPEIGDRELSSLRFVFFDRRGVDGTSSTSPDAVNGFTSSQLLQLALFDGNRIILNFGAQSATGSISSLVATPLPAAAWLFISGILALFGRRYVLARRSNTPV